jgi:hypothetical protein
MKVKGALLAAMILLALITLVPTGMAATKQPFKAKLFFALNFDPTCLTSDGRPVDTCVINGVTFWRHAWVGGDGVVHVRGWTGTFILYEMDGVTVIGTGPILKKDTNICCWAPNQPVPWYVDSSRFWFQAFATMTIAGLDYKMTVTANVKGGQVVSGNFVMTRPGMHIQGKVTSVDYYNSIGTLEGWVLAH